MDTRVPIRPASVTILFWGVLTLGVVNGWRAIGWWQQRSLLIDLNVTAPLFLNLIMAALWALLLSALAVGLWRRRLGTRRAIPAALAAYAIFRLGLLLLLVQTPPAARAWMLPAVGYAISLGLAFWICWRPGNVAYWRPRSGSKVKSDSI